MYAKNCLFNNYFLTINDIQPLLYLPRDSPVTSLTFSYNGTSKTANIKTRLSQQVPADIQETEFFINLSNFMHYCARI